MPLSADSTTGAPVKLFPKFEWAPKEIHKKIQNLVRCLVIWYYTLSNIGRDSPFQRKMCWYRFLELFPDPALVRQMMDDATKAGTNPRVPPDFQTLDYPTNSSEMILYPVIEAGFKKLNRVY